MMTEVGPGLSHLISREKCQTKDHVQLPLEVFVGAEPKDPFHVFEERLVEVKVAPLHPAGRKELLHCSGDGGFEIRQETFWVPVRCSVFETLEGHPVGLLGFVLQQAKGNRNMVFRFYQENPDDKHLNPAMWSRGKCPTQEGDGGVVQLGQVLLGGKKQPVFRSGYWSRLVETGCR